MARFLRKMDDGYIYPWTANLASRPDMEEYFYPTGGSKDYLSEPSAKDVEILAAFDPIPMDSVIGDKRHKKGKSA